MNGKRKAKQIMGLRWINIHPMAEWRKKNIIKAADFFEMYEYVLN